MNNVFVYGELSLRDNTICWLMKKLEDLGAMAVFYAWVVE